MLVKAKFHTVTRQDLPLAMYIDRWSFGRSTCHAAWPKVILLSTLNKMQSETTSWSRCRHLANMTKHTGRLWFWHIRSITWKHDVIHTLLHCRRRSSEPRPQVACTLHLVKFGGVTFEIFERTDRQTYRHADRNILHPTVIVNAKFMISDEDEIHFAWFRSRLALCLH